MLLHFPALDRVRELSFERFEGVGRERLQDDVWMVSPLYPTKGCQTHLADRDINRQFLPKLPPPGKEQVDAYPGRGSP